MATWTPSGCGSHHIQPGKSEHARDVERVWALEVVLIPPGIPQQINETCISTNVTHLSRCRRHPGYCFSFRKVLTRTHVY